MRVRRGGRVPRQAGSRRARRTRSARPRRSAGRRRRAGRAAAPSRSRPARAPRPARRGRARAGRSARHRVRARSRTRCCRARGPRRGRDSPGPACFTCSSPIPTSPCTTTTGAPRRARGVSSQSTSTPPLSRSKTWTAPDADVRVARHAHVLRHHDDALADAHVERHVGGLAAGRRVSRRSRTRLPMPSS